MNDGNKTEIDLTKDKYLVLYQGDFHLKATWVQICDVLGITDYDIDEVRIYFNDKTVVSVNEENKNE